MAKQAIRLKIAGKSYSFTIDSKKEEIYRLAEREVNATALEFERQGFMNFGMQDFLAMTALKYAILNVTTRLEGEVDSDDLKRLKGLEERLADYMNDPTTER